MSYCGQLHQKLHWKAGHKASCGKSGKFDSDSFWCLKEGLLEMEEEPDSDEDPDMEKYERLATEAGNGSMAAVEGLDEVESEQVEDKICERFRARVRRAGDQVVRYERGGEPLLCTSLALDPPPPCQHCGSNRTFEFQACTIVLLYYCTIVLLYYCTTSLPYEIF